MSQRLKIGHITYLNSVPYFERLADNGFSGELLDGVPAELNRMLIEGEVDASLSSSIAYARNWRDYLILPELSIASCGTVKSVLLFTVCGLDSLSGQKVYLTSESATSVCLLKIVLESFHQQLYIEYVTTDEPLEDLVLRNQSVLLIGDRALSMVESSRPSTQYFDLGELWFQATGLPFVFALWMVRKQSAENCPEEIDRLYENLILSRNEVLANTAKYSLIAAEESILSATQIQSYWQTIDYRLGESHLEGLQLFYRYASELGLLEEGAELNFFVPNEKPSISS